MHATEEPKHACKLTKQLRHDCIYNPVPRTLHREDTLGGWEDTCDMKDIVIARTTRVRGKTCLQTLTRKESGSH